MHNGLRQNWRPRGRRLNSEWWRHRRPEEALCVRWEEDAIADLLLV